MATWIGRVERVEGDGTFRVVIDAIDQTRALGPMEATEALVLPLAVGDRVIVHDLAGAASGYVIGGRLGG